MVLLPLCSWRYTAPGTQTGTHAGCALTRTLGLQGPVTELAVLRHLLLQREARLLSQLKGDMAVAPSAVFDLWMKQRSELVRLVPCPRTDAHTHMHRHTNHMTGVMSLLVYVTSTPCSGHALALCTCC